jgi:hypothetical protein
MKTITVPRPVRDVNGLVRALKQSDPPFAVVSVGTDPRQTYIYLEDAEDKNPAPIVEGWVDYPELKVASTGQAGLLGVSEALSNGIDVHTVLIQKTDPSGNVVEGSEKLSVTTPHGVTLSDASPKLSDGMAMVQVGPSEKAGDFLIEVSDRSGKMKSVKVPLRFVKQRVDQEPNQAPVIEKKGGIMATIRRILGI